LKVIGVIPARLGSTRLKNKPLIKIAGKELISWVIQRVKACKKIDDILVATDSEQVSQIAKAMGVRSAMTEPSLPSGTDRIYNALKNEKWDYVLNIQGDEPLINPEWIDKLAQGASQSGAAMATLAHKISESEMESMHAVKVLVNQLGEAIYFSRFAIPCSRVPVQSFPPNAVFKHIGIYAYRQDFLKQFCESKPSAIEISESLEQLRALDLGAKIKVFEVQGKSLGVDTEDDIKKVEEILLNGNY
jgi:3-deoxy-manno-octulosonate cytidylyltransferase (CMP-KDO synthetase)